MVEARVEVLPLPDTVGDLLNQRPESGSQWRTFAKERREEILAEFGLGNSLVTPNERLFRSEDISRFEH